MKNINVPSNWDIEADVVIVGAGGAGMSAAIESAKAGDKVVVLEVAQTAGGSTTLCGGAIYLGGGTALQKECGLEDSVENMYNYLSAAMGHSADKDKIKLYCEKSVETYDWLVSLGVPFKPTYTEDKVIICYDDTGLYYTGNETNYPYNTFANPVPRSHQVAGIASTGNVLFEHLLKAGEAAGVTVIYQAEATDLMIENEQIVGVRAVIEEAEKFVRASKAVVLCAGGFQANNEMLAMYAHPFVGLQIYTGTEFDLGTGIKMGMAVGASLRGMSNCVDWSFIYPPQSKCKGIIVNANGQRFIDESQYGAYIGTAIIKNQDGKAYLILDSKVLAEGKRDVAKMCEHEVILGIAKAAGIEPEILAGDMTMCAEAPTIRELAEKLKMDPDVLENTVAFYNKGASKGEDHLFRKDGKYVTLLDSPPYYAANLCLDAAHYLHHGFITMGGLETDLKSRVLDLNRNPIPRLYAAGRNTSGVQGEHYNSGTSVADAIIFGRIAGQNASAEPKK
ncbi:FAD-dependent oxidoreductase [Phosphitispora sp. TUW77]|uniref:FAD-dependent oxidoreductase n=1 Tax=Phosphitispora sp. TUW77 TaxID=3152361 RepID=UPI003AB58AD5